MGKFVMAQKSDLLELENTALKRELALTHKYIELLESHHKLLDSSQIIAGAYEELLSRNAN
ncbi:MAG: hypothetical protein AAF975_05350 [Spirochaetota bacterium]